MKKVILLLLIFSGNISCDVLTVTPRQQGIVQGLIKQQEQQVKDGQYQVEEEKALLEEKISQVIGEKSTLLSYQTILKGLGAISGASALTIFFYQLLRRFKEPIFYFQDEHGGPGGTEGDEGRRFGMNLPSFLVSAATDTLDTVLSFSSPDINLFRADGSSLPSRLLTKKVISQEQAHALGLRLINKIKNNYIFSNTLCKHIKSLIQQGADVNVTDNNGVTPLHSAVLRDHREIVKILLNAGAHVNVTDNDGYTPLLSAVLMGYREIVKILLDAGSDVNAVDNDGATPLHWAASENYLEVLKMLLHAGANLNPVDNNGATPLYWAVLMDHREIVKILLDAGADANVVDNDGATPLHWAASKNYLEVLKMLLRAGANLNPVDNQGRTPLLDAVDNHCVESALLLILHWVDLGAVGNHPFMLPATPVDEKLIKGVRNLLASGEQLRLMQEVFPRITLIIKAIIPDLIAQAVILGDEELLRTQLEAVPAQVRKALKNIQVIKLNRSHHTSNNPEQPEDTKQRNKVLREADETFSHYSNQIYPDVNAQDQYGWTALHWAMAQHDVPRMLALLQAGADVTLRTAHREENGPYQDMTPLDIASYNQEHALKYDNYTELNACKLVIGFYWSYFSRTTALKGLYSVRHGEFLLVSKHPDRYEESKIFKDLPPYVLKAIMEFANMPPIEQENIYFQDNT
jgi:ankyrin repeat protein